MAETEKKSKKRSSFKSALAAAALSAAVLTGPQTASAQPTNVHNSKPAASRVEQFSNKKPQVQVHTQAPKQEVKRPVVQKEIVKKTVIIEKAPRIVEHQRVDARRGIPINRPAHPFMLNRGWGRPAEVEIFFGQFFAGVNIQLETRNAIAVNISELSQAAAANGGVVYCVNQPATPFRPAGVTAVVEQDGVVTETVTYTPYRGSIIVTTNRIDNGIMVVNHMRLDIFHGRPMFTVAADISW